LLSIFWAITDFIRVGQEIGHPLMLRREEMEGGNDARPQHTRPRFFDICVKYHLYLDELEQIGVEVGVSPSVIHRLFVGDPVSRTQARAVLTLLSRKTGEAYTLENTTITLLGEKGAETLTHHQT
jgi:hypothetical protein